MGRTLKGVTISEPVKGAVKIEARLVLPAIKDDNCGVALVTPSSIAPFLIAPVSSLRKTSKVHQQTRAGWDRVIREKKYESPVIRPKPLYISAGIAWTYHNGSVFVIDQATIIDGAIYLDFLLREGIDKPIPAIIFFSKSEDEDLVLRKTFLPEAGAELEPVSNKVGTTAPRLVIDQKWQVVKIISDPFVIKTAMGYTAGINVTLNKGGVHHIIAGSKSISVLLEDIRRKRGSLEGANIRIRKESEDPRSAYEVELLA